jgi:hypothetical protein
MPEFLQTGEILDHLVTLLAAEFTSSLDLQLCSAQDLSDFEFDPAQLANVAPFVLVRSVADTFELRKAAGLAYEITSEFRIAYGRPWTQGEYRQRAQIDDVKALVDFLAAREQFALPGLTLTTGSMLWTRLSRVQWEGAAEDNLAYAWGLPVRVSVITYQAIYFADVI